MIPICDESFMYDRRTVPYCIIPYSDSQNSIAWWYFKLSDKMYLQTVHSSNAVKVIIIYILWHVGVTRVFGVMDCFEIRAQVINMRFISWSYLKQLANQPVKRPMVSIRLDFRRRSFLRFLELLLLPLDRRRLGLRLICETVVMTSPSSLHFRLKRPGPLHPVGLFVGLRVGLVVGLFVLLVLGDSVGFWGVGVTLLTGRLVSSAGGGNGVTGSFIGRGVNCANEWVFLVLLPKRRVPFLLIPRHHLLLERRCVPSFLNFRLGKL